MKLTKAINFRHLSVGHHSIQYHLLTSVIVLYPFSIKLSGLAIILTFIHWLIWLIRRPNDFVWNNVLMWIMLISYILNIVSLSYSENFKEAIFGLDVKFPLLVLPLVIGSMKPLNPEELKKLLLIAGGSLILFLCVCLVGAAYRFFNGIEDAFFWNNLTVYYWDFHPTYVSMYINFCLVFLFISLFHSKYKLSQRDKIVYWSVVFFFFGMLFLLSSKIQVVFSLLIPWVIIFLLNQKIRWKNIVIVIVILFGFGVITLKDSYLLERFNHIHTLNYELSAPVSDFNELTSRLALAECSWMIIERNLFFGVGIGDVATELNKIYKDVDFKPGYLDRLNPHNEYLSHWLSVGIFGLSTLILVLGLCFVVALKRRNHLFLLIVCIFFLSFIFESMLERNKGVVLFAFLLPLFFNTRDYNIFITKHNLNE